MTIFSCLASKIIDVRNQAKVQVKFWQDRNNIYILIVLAGPGDSGHSPSANTGYGDYDYVFDLDNDGDADFYDGPLGARPAVPGFEPLGKFFTTIFFMFSIQYK